MMLEGFILLNDDTSSKYNGGIDEMRGCFQLKGDSEFILNSEYQTVSQVFIADTSSNTQFIFPSIERIFSGTMKSFQFSSLAHKPW